MRVGGGQSRGRLLKAPRGERPTLGRVRQTLFDMLAGTLAGGNFLEVFAGGGSVGIEALSRGAARATFIEIKPANAALIRENLSRCGFVPQGEVICAEASRALRKLAKRGGGYNIIFLDPPYEDAAALGRTLAAALAEAENLLLPGGSIIIERSRRHPAEPPETLTLRETRIIGDSALDFLSKREQRMATALYAGSFDPITCGHLDIIQRASSLFDKLVVTVAENTEKSPLFGAPERFEMVQEACRGLKNVEVRLMESGLLVDYALQAGAKVVVRGLRAVSDFDYELQLASMNRSLRPELETVFFMTAPEHYFLSSSMVKDIARLGGDVGEFVPAHVLQALRARFNKTTARERRNPK
jgi:pantetheine-phosphate adenylyltransferase